MAESGENGVVFQLGRYRVLRELGRGSSGVVYLGLHVSLRRPAAVKVLHAEFLPDARRAVRARAAAVARIEHRALCPILEVGEDGDTAFVAMVLLEGETLAERIADRGARHAPPDRAICAALAGAFAAVADGLAALHDAGFAHGDIKPANLMATAADAVVVLDLADAVPTESAGGVGARRGTAAYLAPERVEGGAASAAADQFALAASLYECLTLRPAFEAPSTEALFRRVLRDRPSPAHRRNPAVPRDLAVVLDKALAREPEQRYADAASFAEDLRRVAAGAPIAARPLPWWARLGRWAMAHPAAAALGVALLLAQLVLVWAVLGAWHATQAARTAAEQADAVLRHVDTLTHRSVLDVAVRAADALVPAWPEDVPALESWQRVHAAAVADLRRDAARARGELSPLSAATRPAVTTALDDLERELAAFDRDVVPAVARRLARARAMAAANAGPLADAWRAVAADVRVSPHYGGLRLAPQPGLVPLGVDPITGLHEFYHPGSAERSEARPARGPGGLLTPTPGMGLVFVLLPGGRAAMGAQHDDPAAPRYDPRVGSYSLPHWVDLDPFLLSKYELTRGQWRRLGDETDPSEYRAGEVGAASERELLRHPVQRVSAEDCARVLRELGMALPTEAQWEHGCRGGTLSVHFMGDDPGALLGYANFGDYPPKPPLGQESPGNVLKGGAVDGFAFTAPVGSFGANPFGLHDVLGNVAEWCQDRFADYSLTTPEPGTGLRRTPAHAETQVYRGPSFEVALEGLGSARRENDLPHHRSYRVGVRPVHRLRR